MTSAREGKTEEQCYPCSVYGHGCVLREAWQPGTGQKRRVVVPVLPYSNGEENCTWFDVVLWVYDYQHSFPQYVGYVEAVDAFAAVEQMMQFYQMRTVAYASAYSMDGSLIYRAYQVGVWLS